MSKTFYFFETVKKFLYFSLISLVLFFQFKFQMVHSLSIDDYQNGLIVEELRLKIPKKFKDVWLEAEKNIWEPWLTNQDGFLGRQIYWDSEKEEALILVNWENKKLWKNISKEQVDEVQKKFEEDVKMSLNQEKNPFQLIYEGELYKQQ